MFFLISKLAWLVAAPANLLFLGALVGVVVARGPRAASGRRFALACLTGLLVAALSPAGALIIAPLEGRFPAPTLAGPPYGVIILGGAIDEELSAARGQTALADGAARLTEGAALARRFVQAQVVYSGGSSSLAGGASSEAAAARDLMIALGVEAPRIAIEERSRNTDENARFSADLLKPEATQSWLLVTSAYHMPRAMGLFRKAGFNVVAYPVDYRTAGDRRDLRIAWTPLRNVQLFDLAIHEWIGLAAYRLTGKIDDFFPAP